MSTVILAVDNMRCVKCVANVERRYRELPGVSEVVVDLEGKQARVVFDPEVCADEDLMGALDGTDFRGGASARGRFEPFSPGEARAGDPRHALRKLRGEHREALSRDAGRGLCAGRPRIGVGGRLL